MNAKDECCPEREEIMADKKTVLSIGLSLLDVTAFGVMNPALWKEKQRIRKVDLVPGGDAANQSIFLAALGLHACLNAAVGSDESGMTIRTVMESRGVDTRYLRVKEGQNTGVALILVDDEGKRTVFSTPGAHRKMNGGDLPEKIPEDLAAITIGSFFAIPEAEEDGLEEFLKKAKAKGVLIFGDLDTAGVVYDPVRLERFAPLMDYFIPSLYDVMPYTGENSVEKAVEKLHRLGTENIIIKCGEKGALVDSPSFKGTVPALKVDPVDTTGAGDCMSAAVVSRILAGDTVRDAARYGCAAGSLCTLYPGANSIHLTHEMVINALEGKEI